MPNYNEFCFSSSDGKTQIHAEEWLPEGEVRAVLQIAHGVSEYIHRYADFAKFLCEHGIAVVGNDHIGHGKSVAEGAPRIFFGEKNGWNNVVDDMYKLCEIEKEKFPDVPYFLMGHSMGSFLARTFLIKYPNSVDGAVIMGTGQQGKLLIAGGKIIAKGQMKKFGAGATSPKVNSLAFGSYNKKFAPARTSFDWLSVNEENVDRYIADPLCGEDATIGLFLDMLGGIDFIGRQENVEKMNKNLPVLFISGSEDPVGGTKGVTAAWKTFQKAGIKDLELKLYPGLRHEILNEKSNAEVYEFLLNWLEKRISAASKEKAYAAQ
jgi:alpha-beta hydrolase superfamily lysophospholipase